MRRAIALGALILLGALSIGIAAYQGQGQGGGQAAPPVVTVEKVRDNLFMLVGGGGNTSAFITTNGVVLVDAKNPGWGQPILDKVKTLTDKPVTMLINSHTHGDHVSGNVEFPTSVDIITHQNTKTNMEKMDIFKKNAGRGLPKRTFTDRMTIGSGANQIDLYYFGPWHTNGDAVVVFPSLRVAHFADLFAGKNAPFMDGTNGGSGVQYPQTLANAISTIKNVDTIVNGHTPMPTTWNDLVEFQSYVKDFVAWVETQMKAGKTTAATVAEYTIPEKYKGYTPGMRVQGDVELIYSELKK